ncbi:DUF4333 domain-containing protein [Geodermatophilus sp. CPCC 206100]|uniref:DUF4333 domain-containing protein n=1 Tax=Geodermatophilus sp. CPCC 206100 TaxID=3020054 RepID=UPI003AFFEBBF
MSRPGRRPVLLVAAPVLALAVSSCSSTVAQSELETQVADALEKATGVSPEVSCPGDLDAEVDATTECTATDPDSGEEFAYRITVTSVEDDQAEFDIEPVD